MREEMPTAVMNIERGNPKPSREATSKARARSRTAAPGAANDARSPLPVEAVERLQKWACYGYAHPEIFLG